MFIFFFQNFGLPQHGGVSLGNSLSKSPGLDGSIGGLDASSANPAAAAYTDFTSQVLCQAPIT